MTDFSRRDVTRGAVGAMATVAAGPLLAQTDGGAGAQALRHVHPELRSFAAMIYGMQSKDPAPVVANLPAIRQGAEIFTRPPTDDVTYDKRSIPGAKGSPEVTIYVINAKSGTSRPGILHTHGGGFIAGKAAAGIRYLQRTARELDCAIVSVDYRLAPETTWSGSAEDTYAGLKWLYANADTLGVDRQRIAVMGESAGGGHAALLAINARDRGEVPVAFQCLVYPMLDDRTASSQPVPAHIGTLLWTGEQNRFGWRSFLGTEPGGASVPPAVPSRVASFHDLPPAWIGVGGIDLFVSEDIEYARRLDEAGVMTELVVVPGAFHGFDVLPEITGQPVAIAAQFNANKMAASRRALSTGAA